MAHRRFVRLAHWAWLVLGLATVTWLVPASFADASVAFSPASAAPENAGTLLAMIRVLGALALVLATFFGGLWLWRNWQRLLVRQGAAPKLTVLEGKSLGQRHTIYVIGYEQQRMLVAASPSGVTMLTSLPPAEASVVEVAAVENTRPAAPAFGALLLRAIAQR